MQKIFFNENVASLSILPNELAYKIVGHLGYSHIQVIACVNKLFNLIVGECDSCEENLSNLNSVESYFKISRETRFSAGLHRKITINDDPSEKYPKKRDNLNSQIDILNKILSLGKSEGNHLLHGVDKLEISFTETEPTSSFNLQNIKQ